MPHGGTIHLADGSTSITGGSAMTRNLLLLTTIAAALAAAPLTAVQAEEFLRSAANDAERAADNTGDTLEHGAHRVGRTLEEGAHDVGHALGEGAEETRSFFADLFDDDDVDDDDGLGLNAPWDKKSWDKK
jgi:hypothetical protein